MDLKYKNITVSGKIATGTTTLAKNLAKVLRWKYVNAGELQRQWDREHGIAENECGATVRPDEREKGMEELAKKTLTDEAGVVYEAWLSGFVAKKIPGVLKILVVCSDEALRIDRVVNRDGYSVEQAIQFIKKREEENIAKWKKLYGNFDFWDPGEYDLVIDTYSSGPLETLGKALDKLGYKGEIHV